MNLYLYLANSSAHPPSCIKGTIYGLVRRYYLQNTYQKDYVSLVRLLFQRLLRRGWDRGFLRDTIIDASNRVETAHKNITTTPATIEEANRLFLHLEYHPDDVPRSRIQTLYANHLGDLLHTELGIGRPTIAYSRPKNIGDFITRSRLHQAPGQLASNLLGEYENGLSPS